MKFVAFYGTLTRAFDVQRRLGLDSELRFVSACSIPGRLYDLGDYPGLVAARGVVRGEVFELLGERTLERLDDFEDYDPAEPRASEYIRRLARLVAPDQPLRSAGRHWYRPDRARHRHRGHGRLARHRPLRKELKTTGLRGA